MMWCNHCGGRIFSDREYLSESHLELYCVLCAKRWIFHHPTQYGGFVTWLHNKELIHREWKTNH